MQDEPIVVKRDLSVRGVFSDTRVWLARYRQARHDVVAALRQIPGFVETVRQLAPTELYRIEWSPEMITALREGSAVWRSNKEGFLGVVLRKPGGEILKHLSLEQVSPVQFAPMVQLATQSMLSEVIGRLETIDQKVSDILQGQVADRLGPLRGAEAQFLAAVEASGEERIRLLRDCIGPYESARGVLIENLRAKLSSLDLTKPAWWRVLQYLPGKRSAGDRVRETMNEVHRYLMGAMRATRILEVLYGELGQSASAKKALALFAEQIEDLLPVGQVAARWLAYSQTNPPEALWQSTQQMIEGPVRHAQQLLGAADQCVELEVQREELLIGERL